MKVLQPHGWPRPKGYANGIAARGEMVFLAGVVGWDAEERFPTGLVAQFRQALENIVAILAEGGAKPEHVVRMTWYITSRDHYLAHGREIGAVYREIMGKHFPVMAVVQVVALMEAAAEIEIEVTAVIPD
ncbi:RidA family protein [Novosphingobium sp. PASSN1]|uniref:RidA family protein n=1 Tax=Novosphingobium sp. PASSN1 TaxID=2015561 RepID=UPI000BD0EF88|nr:RidA family protein [Novosphingobium sp. PASSN1]OYU33657.1 MAG: enamine deaminase RidA [Novosphingobium sp. PASSN1]